MGVGVSYERGTPVARSSRPRRSSALRCLLLPHLRPGEAHNQRFKSASFSEEDVLEVSEPRFELRFQNFGLKLPV